MIRFLQHIRLMELRYLVVHESGVCTIRHNDVIGTKEPPKSVVRHL